MKLLLIGKDTFQRDIYNPSPFLVPQCCKSRKGCTFVTWLSKYEALGHAGFNLSKCWLLLGSYPFRAKPSLSASL